ncbi:uncharacterized protein DS421_9g270000 [Arachis hypogaea]|nr:uncharacterized protein DS421_9g270000 [Arachis hypogaea]
MRKVASRRLPCPYGGQNRKWCMRPRACVLGESDAAGYCPALVEGRAEFSWCARFCPCALLLAETPLVRANLVHHKMLPCLR